MKDLAKIYLVGFMGSGKSTLGKQLANKLDMGFLDLDSFIEEREGKTVQELFDQHGEVYFREVEKKALQTIIEKKESLVVALGGGTPCFHDNMEMINQSGISVYLKYNSGILAARLKNAKIERPLIKDKSEVELLSFIESKLDEREQFYCQSHITLEGDNIKSKDVMDLLEKMV